MATPCTVTATLNDTSATALQGNAFVRFRLRNYSGFVPRVLGTAILVETQIDVVPNSSGLVTTQLWGNDSIDPGGTNNPPSTFYTVEYWNQGRITSQGNFSIIGGSFNLGTAAQINPPPTPGGSGATALLLEVNGVKASSQTVQNLVGSNGISVADAGGGTIQISGSTGGGALSIASAVAPATLNLTTDGAYDWVAISPNNNTTADYIPQSWRWKLNNGELSRNIRNITISGVSPAGEGAPSGSALSLTANAGDEVGDVTDNFSAPGASPLTNSTAWRGLFNSAGQTGYGWRLSCASNSVTRTLKLYVTLQPAVGQFGIRVNAHLLDGSVADVHVDLATVGTTPQTNVITITFASASPSQLVVTALANINAGNNGEIRFLAATVS